MKKKTKWFCINKCRSCNSNELVDILDLNDQPPANSLKKKINDNEFFAPLKIIFCKNCKLVQLSATIDPAYLFKKYNWVTGTSEIVKVYAQKFYNNSKKYMTKNKANILEIASNDGTFLDIFKRNGHQVLGVDPAKNIAKIANQKKIKTLPYFFNADLVNKNLSLKNFNPDIIIARNVIPHVKDIHSIIKSFKLLSNTNTVCMIEFHYSKKIINELHYDSIYHEHLFYFSIKSLSYLFRKYNLHPFDIFESPISGGSVVLMFSTKKLKKSKKLINMIKKEKISKINSLSAWKIFAKSVTRHAENLNKVIKKESQNNEIIGFGASARSSTLLNYLKATNQEIKFIIDNNKIKHKLFTAGTNIKILPFEKLKIKSNKVIILLAWNFKKEIISFLRKKGFQGKIIIPLPKIKILK